MTEGRSRGKSPRLVVRNWKAIALPAAALLALTIVAYLPALRAGYIWDDPDYVTNNATLRSTDGLRQIWFDTSATPQYYPAVFTSFWIEYHLWGLSPAGFHLINVLLHATSAILLWMMLRRWKLPAAWLAAGIFAVHPVHVESAAWVTERKNVLSGVFYLAAFYSYWLARESPKVAFWKRYGAAIVLFVAALLSKSVACSLPAAMLLVIWWREGRIQLKRDVLPLLPFFVIGLTGALHTAWLERAHVGAVGAEWAFTPAARCLIAGRALWFYLLKIVWPANLTFIYPKWSIDAGAPWQWAFPIAAVLLVAVLYLLRKKLGRGPLVAALFFGGTLLPALGFFNLYPMRYSFVADHFQYLASLGPIILIAVVLERFVKPANATLVVLVPLVVLTFRQSQTYLNAETLWRDTLAKNPDAWMVQTNLANALADQRRFDEAFEHYQSAARLAPDLPETHWNLGAALERRGDLEAALAELDRATQIDPTFAGAYFVRGNIYFKQGRILDAKQQANIALQHAPDYADAHYLLARIAEQDKDAETAIAEYRKTVQSSLGNANAHYNLANLLRASGKLDEALIHYSQAVQIRPNWAEAHANLGATLLQLRRTDEAIRAFQMALAIDPDLTVAQRNLQIALRQRSLGQ